MSAGEIYIPEGVNTLRFGGVDVNYTPDGRNAAHHTDQNNEFQIDLGFPSMWGPASSSTPSIAMRQANTGNPTAKLSRTTQPSW